MYRMALPQKPFSMNPCLSSYKLPPPRNLITTRMFFSTLIGLIISIVNPHLGTCTTYSYDANGNMLSDGTYCYQYNEANQVSKVIDCSTNQFIAEYSYDHDGKRVVKKEYENGQLQHTVYYIGKHFETKVYPNGRAETTSYYYANDERVARKDSDAKKYFYHGDHLGSTSILTDESGDLIDKTEYYPYGLVRSGGTKGKFLYTGQEKDSETGLYYYKARYYDPGICRFAQPDSVDPDVYSPKNLNRYAYVLNNPLNNTDPSGHQAEGVKMLPAPPKILALPYRKLANVPYNSIPDTLAALDKAITAYNAYTAATAESGSWEQVKASASLAESLALDAVGLGLVAEAGVLMWNVAVRAQNDSEPMLIEGQNLGDGVVLGDEGSITEVGSKLTLISYDRVKTDVDSTHSIFYGTRPEARSWYKVGANPVENRVNRYLLYPLKQLHWF